MFNIYLFWLLLTGTSGDYLCVVCTNPQDLVGSIAARLLLDLDDIATVEKVENIPDSEGTGGRGSWWGKEWGEGEGGYFSLINLLLCLISLLSLL